MKIRSNALPGRPLVELLEIDGPRLAGVATHGQAISDAILRRVPAP